MTDPYEKNLLYEVGMKTEAMLKLEKKQRDARQGSREGTVHPYNGMISLMLQETEEILKARLRRRIGKSALGVVALRQSNLKLRTVCAIAARTVVDGVSSGHRIQTITERIGTRVEDEVRMKEFKRREPLLYKWMQESLKERGSEDYTHKREVLIAALRRANSDEQWEPWDTRTKAGLGLLLCDAMLQTGFIEKVEKPTPKAGRITIMIHLTDEAERALSEADARAHELLDPWFKPMLMKPVDWTDPETGGYLMADLPIMKTRSRQTMERLRHADMPAVYASLNAIQRTAWRINEDVLQTAEILREEGIEIEGLPVYGEDTRPIRPDLPPVGEDLDEGEKDLLRGFKVARRDWFNAMAKRRSKTTQCLQIMDIAGELRHEPAIYFPHQLDYRGRAYAIPLQLNPQGNDLAKGLLTFAETRPLGEMGGYWLAVHGANTFGVDKGPLNDRVDWVLENEDRIKVVAEDPLADLWWIEADGGKKPWQFLAWCLEYAAYLESGESPDFESRLPVSVDGACNGIQHFSAMLRDPQGALATNLTSDPDQHDIYQEVANATLEQIRAKRHASEQDREMAGIWMEFGVARGTVKRPVMTTPYGCTMIGMKEQILGDTIKADKSGAYFGERQWETAQWLATEVYAAIGTTVSAAQGAMTFLQEMAKVTAAQDQPITWTTPVGLPVLQDIKRANLFMVSTSLLGRIRLRYAETTEELDKRKQRSSVTPNFVHSYDAAHLMLTVTACEEELGRPLSWAMVHDSYGTHAGDVQEMNRVLREQFVAMYTDRDPLGDLRQRVANSVPVGTMLPDTPPVGTFDLREVLNAEFFFA